MKLITFAVADAAAFGGSNKVYGNSSKKNVFAVGKSGNMRMGGPQITPGNSVICETIIKKLWKIDALKEKIALLETRLVGESE